MNYVLQSDDLLGDRLMQGPTIRTLKKENPKSRIICHVPRIDTGIHVTGTEVLLQGNPYVDEVVVGPRSERADELLIPMVCSAAFQYGVANNLTITESFGVLAGVQIDSLAYDYASTLEEILDALKLAKSELGGANQFVICARHSASCASNDPKVRVANKCVANRFWIETANWLIQQGYTPVAVGSAKEEKDARYHPWPGVKLYGRPIREIAALLPMSAAVLTIDTGIRHLAAATGANMYCLSGAIPLSLIRCEPVEEEQKIVEEHKPLPYVTAQTLIAGIQKVLP